jgi:hypothetical protein
MPLCQGRALHSLVRTLIGCSAPTSVVSGLGVSAGAAVAPFCGASLLTSSSSDSSFWERFAAAVPCTARATAVLWRWSDTCANCSVLRRSLATWIPKYRPYGSLSVMRVRCCQRNSSISTRTRGRQIDLSTTLAYPDSTKSSRTSAVLRTALCSELLRHPIVYRVADSFAPPSACSCFWGFCASARDVWNLLPPSAVSKQHGCSP